MPSTARPAVSVVVPVFAPGPYIRPLLDSLDRQQPPEGGFEVVFVDDGSTDATGELLEAWAATRQWAHVLRLPGSGWPSHPRNVGVKRARGEYVFFVDHDDWLAPDALARMTAFARTERSDVVIGRMRGVGRRVPVKLFAHTVADAHAPQTPLQDSMTVHVMFRRAFLDATRIRFDESLRRLEDHHFMAMAYMRAARVSVLGGEAVYLHAARSDGANAAHRPFEPADYYAALSRALDVVLKARVDADERDAYVGRWVRKEMIDRLRSDAVRSLPADERLAYFGRVQRLLRDRVPAESLRALPAEYRWPATLARSATADEFWRADDVMTGSTTAALRDRPGSETLSGVVGPESLSDAIALLGEDAPLPAGRATGSHRGRRRRAARAWIIGTASSFAGGRVRERIISWGRSTSRLVRDAGATAVVLAAAAATVLAAIDAAPVVAMALAAVAAALTAWLAVRSLGGAPTAVREVLVLAPALALAVRGAAPGATGYAIAACLATIGFAWFSDSRLRRTDVRGYPSRQGGILARVGRIGLTAIAVCALVLAVDAVTLLAA